MKQLFYSFAGQSGTFFLLLLLLGACGVNVDTPDAAELEDLSGSSTDDGGGERVLRHAVFFAFRDSVSAERITEVDAAFASLQDSIPGILAFEHGLNNSPERLNNGLTHAYLLTFGSEKDRNAYLPHPAHARFGEMLSPLLKDVLVVDYWTGE